MVQELAFGLEKVLRLPPPLAVHRPDASRGLSILVDARVRAALLGQLDTAPEWRKTKVTLDRNGDTLLRQLHKDTGIPLYRLMAAALLAVAFDPTCPTSGRRTVRMENGAVVWTATAAVEAPATTAQPFAPPADACPTAEELARSLDTDALSAQLSLTRQAWADAPTNSATDILRRAGLARGIRLLEQALPISCRRRPTKASVAPPAAPTPVETEDAALAAGAVLDAFDF